LRLEPFRRVIQDAQSWFGLLAHRTEHGINVIDGDLAVLIRVCVRVLFEPRAVGQHVDDLQHVDRRDEAIAVDVRSDLAGYVCRRSGCGCDSKVSGEQTPGLQRFHTKTAFAGAASAVVRRAAIPLRDLNFLPLVRVPWSSKSRSA
tara:strand:+ start:77847 stop:78284 length:438 start_codon:yes stop_codon:yes gene_type:complete